MATTPIRTTVAFDPGTVSRWERLARRWGVSKSEVLRRALQIAEAGLSPATTGTGPPAPPLTAGEIADMSPAEAFAWLESHSLVPAEAGDLWRDELRQNREDFASRP